jgi:hypothetical protein
MELPKNHAYPAILPFFADFFIIFDPEPPPQLPFERGGVFLTAMTQDDLPKSRGLR